MHNIAFDHTIEDHQLVHGESSADNNNQLQINWSYNAKWVPDNPNAHHGLNASDNSETAIGITFNVIEFIVHKRCSCSASSLDNVIVVR